LGRRRPELPDWEDAGAWPRRAARAGEPPSGAAGLGGRCSTGAHTGVRLGESETTTTSKLALVLSGDSISTSRSVCASLWEQPSCGYGKDKALFSFQKILQNFSNSLSHRIFRRMHGVLNIDENKN